LREFNNKLRAVLDRKVQDSNTTTWTPPTLLKKDGAVMRMPETFTVPGPMMGATAICGPLMEHGCLALINTFYVAVYHAAFIISYSFVLIRFFAVPSFAFPYV
jgi:hypothetical protein